MESPEGNVFFSEGVLRLIALKIGAAAWFNFPIRFSTGIPIPGPQEYGQSPAAQMSS